MKRRGCWSGELVASEAETRRCEGRAAVALCRLKLVLRHLEDEVAVSIYPSADGVEAATFGSEAAAVLDDHRRDASHAEHEAHAVTDLEPGRSCPSFPPRCSHRPLPWTNFYHGVDPVSELIRRPMTRSKETARPLHALRQRLTAGRVRDGGARPGPKSWWAIAFRHSLSCSSFLCRFQFLASSRRTSSQNESPIRAKSLPIFPGFGFPRSSFRAKANSARRVA
jgi:hypothetical protein